MFTGLPARSRHLIVDSVRMLAVAALRGLGPLRGCWPGRLAAMLGTEWLALVSLSDWEPARWLLLALRSAEARRAKATAQQLGPGCPWSPSSPRAPHRHPWVGRTVSTPEWALTLALLG